eukprot:gene22618-13585_t
MGRRFRPLKRSRPGGGAAAWQLRARAAAWSAERRARVDEVWWCRDGDSWAWIDSLPPDGRPLKHLDTRLCERVPEKAERQIAQAYLLPPRLDPERLRVHWERGDAERALDQLWDAERALDQLWDAERALDQLWDAERALDQLWDAERALDQLWDAERALDQLWDAERALDQLWDTPCGVAAYDDAVQAAYPRDERRDLVECVGIVRGTKKLGKKEAHHALLAVRNCFGARAAPPPKL